MANVYVLSGIVTVFIFLGFTTPYITTAFEQGSVSSPNLESYEDSLGQELEQVNAIRVTDVLWSLLSIWFWTFGALPQWFDLCILLPMRILLAYIIIDLLWIGGGG